MRLVDLAPCWQGVIPAHIATCSADGTPNVTYLSQVSYVDERHVALSCQFFNKTRRNVAENPHATLVFYDPVTFQAWRMVVRFDHSETEGPLFDEMRLRIDVIASHTGMAGVFRLLSADVYEVLGLEPLDGFLMPPDPLLDASASASEPAGGPLTELRGLQVVSERIARAESLGELLDGALESLDELFGFQNTMVLLADGGGILATAASRGYCDHVSPVRVAPGEGLIGTVAERRRVARIVGMRSELSYGRAVRERATESERAAPAEDVPLPGLQDVQAQLALPLLSGTRLVGVLAVESGDPLCFDEWDEAFLQIVANQIAVGVDRMQAREPSPSAGSAASAEPREFTFYRNDDCVFTGGEYLVRNVPGRILWKLLTEHARDGRTEFTNRELRLDPKLGLPALKDNLESRLILLRKRLAERCPDVRIVPAGRGRFTLALDREIALTERETA